MSDPQRLPREQATHVEYGAHLEPQLRVGLGERFVIETNDNWFNLLGEEGAIPSVTEPPVAAGREVRWPLAPFIGTIVTAPERGIENTLIGQGPWGGNIDTRDIAAGHRIHLNAAHAGGLLFLGDVHGSQGDSELTGIADETAADVTLSCDVLKGVSTPGVCRIEKPDSLVQVDSARNAGSMEAALRDCFMNMMRWLVDDHGMDRREAYLHMTANSGVRINVYQFVSPFFTCGVEFPRRNL